MAKKKAAKTAKTTPAVDPQERLNAEAEAEGAGDVASPPETVETNGIEGQRELLAALPVKELPPVQATPEKSKDDEVVLGVPRAVFEKLSYFNGFTGDSARYLPKLLEPESLPQWRRRGDCEHDPSFKQLIPYLIVRTRAGGVEQFFTYRRKGDAKNNEGRLLAKRSAGIGGHIDRDKDGAEPAQAYFAGVARELAEECGVNLAGSAHTIIGCVNDEGTDVGKVHLGFVYVVDVTDPAGVHGMEEAIHEGKFEPLSSIMRDLGSFEPWSISVLSYLHQLSSPKS